MGSTLRGIDLRYTFLKLDTQGFDSEVLKGGPESASKIPALQTEVSVLPVYPGMPNFSESLAVLTGMGVAISDLFIISADTHLRAVEFDCLMVRAS